MSTSKKKILKLLAHPFDDETPSKEVTSFEFTGYQFGDRLLEDVPFVATLIDGELQVRFKTPDGPYERGLNQDHWINKIRKALNSSDFIETGVADIELVRGRLGDE